MQEAIAEEMAVKREKVPKGGKHIPAVDRKAEARSHRRASIAVGVETVVRANSAPQLKAAELRIGRASDIRRGTLPTLPLSPLGPKVCLLCIRDLVWNTRVAASCDEAWSAGTRVCWIDGV